MLNNKNGLMFNSKFKKMYCFITFGICIFWILLVTVLNLFGNEFMFKNIFYTYYNALFIVLLIVGMIIDEKIRKYPGFITTIGTAVYSLCYIYLCCFRTNIFLVVLYVVNGVLSYLIYKYIYPKIIVTKNGNKIFNTIYLIIILTITLILGMYYTL